MKATGIIRRIDELGRIVIPKEIRKAFKINEGENIEIFINDDEQIVLKKYSIVKKIKDLSNHICDSIYNIFKYDVLITDTDNIIACSPSLRKELLSKQISNYLESVMSKRENVISYDQNIIEISQDINITSSYIISCIVYEGDVKGLIIIMNVNNKLNETDLKLIKTVSNFLTKYLEE